MTDSPTKSTCPCGGLNFRMGHASCLVSKHTQLELKSAGYNAESLRPLLAKVRAGHDVPPSVLDITDKDSYLSQERIANVEIMKIREQETKQAIDERVQSVRLATSTSISTPMRTPMRAPMGAQASPSEESEARIRVLEDKLDKMSISVNHLIAVYGAKHADDSSDAKHADHVQEDTKVDHMQEDTNVNNGIDAPFIEIKPGRGRKLGSKNKPK